MALPGNEWGNVVPPQTFSYIRNSFLTILGLGVAVAFLRDGIAHNERTFVALAGSVFASYLFYIPVILFIRSVPALGMLMIPKTLAYLVIAAIGLRSFFAKRPVAHVVAP